jgi:hypothetical protein
MLLLLLLFLFSCRCCSNDSCCAVGLAPAAVLEVLQQTTSNLARLWGLLLQHVLQLML